MSERGNLFAFASLKYVVPDYDIGPLIRRGKGCYFWLDPKVTKRSSRKNPSTRKARLPGPRFPAGLCPLLFSMVLMFICLLIFV
jgi:hypothetical protein